MKAKSTFSRWFILFLLLVLFPCSVLFFAFYIDSKEKSFESSHINAPYILAVTEKKWSLVFFGYVGCSEICNPRMQEMADLYHDPELKPIRQQLDIIFINIQPDMEPKMPQTYAASFDPDFKGLYLDRLQLATLDRQLKLVFSSSFFDSKSISHPNQVYLLKQQDNKLYLIRILRQKPLRPKVILNAIS